MTSRDHTAATDGAAHATVVSRGVPNALGGPPAATSAGDRQAEIILGSMRGVVSPLIGLLLSPILAALAMSFGSVTVIGNADRLKRFKIVEVAA